MTARQKITLTFGDRAFDIRGLTMSQVVDLSDLFANPALARESQAARLKLACDAIKIALRRDHPDVDVDDLDCDVQELPKQLMAIMEVGGFNPAASEPGGSNAADPAAQS